MKASEKKQRQASFDRRDALMCKPVKNPEVIVIRMETGEILLTYPVTLRPWLGRLLGRFGKRALQTRTKKLQLDVLGTSAWEMMNGMLTVQQIVEKFAKKYQLHVQEAEAAVTCFIRDLGKRGLIALK